jgi:hypothetical protein
MLEIRGCFGIRKGSIESPWLTFINAGLCRSSCSFDGPPSSWPFDQSEGIDFFRAAPIGRKLFDKPGDEQALTHHHRDSPVEGQKKCPRP